MDKCDTEQLIWSDMLPKMEAIINLGDDMVVREGIVSPDSVGSQQEYYNMEKVRVEILVQYFEIIDELRDKTMDYIGGLHDLIDKLIGTNSGETIIMESTENLIRIFREYVM
ncbi:hypothetical protein KI387_035808, partial [Taxus chinensis]